MSMASNIALRRTQIGIPITILETATGISRQQIHKVTSDPSGSSMRTLQKIAMMLYCPVSALASEDPTNCVAEPLPPADFVERLSENRERLFGDDPPSWQEYKDIIAKPTEVANG